MSMRAPKKRAYKFDNLDSKEEAPSPGSAPQALAGAPAAQDDDAVKVHGEARSCEQAQQAVWVMGFVDVAMLSLPAVLILAAPSQDDEACGWTPRGLGAYGLGSAACLWFSVIVAAAQAFVLSGALGHGRSAALARRLGWHLVLPVLGLLAGSGLGTYGLLGFAALATNLCDTTAHALPVGAVSAGYVLAALYLLLPCSAAPPPRRGGAPKVHPHLDAAEPAAPADVGGGSGGKPPAAEEECYPGGRSSSCSTATPGVESAYSCVTSVLSLSSDSGDPQHLRRDSRQLASGSDGVAKPHPDEGSFGARSLNVVPAVVPDAGGGALAAARRRSSNISNVSFSKGGGVLAARRRSSTRSIRSLKDASEVRRLVSPTSEMITPGSKSKVEDRFTSVFAERRTSIRNTIEEEEQTRRSSNTSGFEPHCLLSSELGVVTERSEDGEESARGSGPASAGTSQRHSDSFSAAIENRTLTTRSSISELTSSHLLSRLDKPVFFCSRNPINFDNLNKHREDLSSSEDSDFGEDEDGDTEDSAEEVWCTRGGGQIEVPIWLMDKLHRRSETLVVQADEHSKPPQSAGGGQVASLPGALDARPDLADVLKDDAAAPDSGGGLGTCLEEGAQACEGKARRVSFMDQETGVPFHKYSEEKKTSISMGSGPPSAFWKIPMPTRTNSIRVPQAKRQGDSGGDYVEVEGGPGPGGPACSSGAAGSVDIATLADIPPPPLPPLACRRQSRMSRKHNLVTQQDGGRGKRPSVLGIFSEGGQEGLYAVPKDPTEEQPDNIGEIVEVTNSSLVMSSSIMEQILNSKSLGQHDKTDLTTQDGGGNNEIVLPFFCPMKKDYQRQCHCGIDELTGKVIHTCMSPNTTQGNCTEVDQSYVCSAWNSNHGSKHGTQAMGSRRMSDESKRQLVVSEAQVRKRIRNESVLGIGGCGPAPNSKQEDDEAEEQEATNENELTVSFSSIQMSRTNSQRGSTASLLSSTGSDISSQKNAETPESPEWFARKEGIGEKGVEAQLGHLFDIVEPQKLSVMLKDVELREQLLVVDVRGRDWVGGHIPSSVNLRTSEVLKHPETLLAQCRQNRIHTVVFTCMYSVLRARKCATALERVQAEEQKAGWHAPYRIRLQLLQGGMHAWVNYFMGPSLDCSRHMPEHLISFDPQMWSDGGPSQGGLVHVMDAIWTSGGQKALSDALTQELFSLQVARGASSPQESSRRSSENEGH